MFRVSLQLTLCIALIRILPAQSTYGVILGTVKDASGADVPNAKITITNTDKNTTRELKSNAYGEYDGENILPGRYAVTVQTSGFDTFQATNLELVARQTLRVDAILKVGQSQQTVTVNDAEAGVIATDSNTIQASFDPKALLNLPANIRANGNTSPYQLIQVLPGVQGDDGNPPQLSIQGGIPSQTQYSLDGISTTDVTGNQPLTNAFPSTESLAESRCRALVMLPNMGKSATSPPSRRAALMSFMATCSGIRKIGR